MCFTGSTCAHKRDQQKQQAETIKRINNSPNLPLATKRAFERQSKYPTGHCFGRPLAHKGLALTPYEFYDKLAVNFGKQPVHVPAKCACGAAYTLEHALTCPTGGNRIGRHNMVRDEAGDLCEESLGASSFHVSYELVIGERGDGKKSDIRARGLNPADQMKETDIDIRLFYPDAPSYIRKPIDSLLQQQEKEKMVKYKDRVEAQGRLFLPFIISTDGVIGEEGRKMMGWLGSKLGKKWGKDRSLVMAYVRAKMSVAIARAVSACIRGDRTCKRVNRGF